MPDGDIVHSRLARFYKKPYQWLCERKANSDECARVAMEALKRDLMRKGDLPIILAKRMGEILERTINDASESSSVDWVALNMEFDTLVWQADGRPDLKELTLCAAKSVLHDLRYGREIDADNTSEAILKRYMFNGVYESEFKERILLFSEHHNGIDEVTLTGRIEEIQAGILAATSRWAKKATEDQSVENLRLPRRPRLKPVDLDEDLLCTAG